MIYVGHTKFRWHGMSQVLQALEPVRDEVGRVALVGDGWDNPPEWTADGSKIKDDYYVDRDYLKQAARRGHAADPLPRGHRHHEPRRLQSGGLSPAVRAPGHGDLPHVRDAGGRHHPAVPAGPELRPRDLRRAAPTELVLGGERPHDKIVDVLPRPEHYAEIVRGIRQEFGQRHTPEARLRELIEIIEE